MNFANNKKKNLLAATANIIRKRRWIKAIKKNSTTGLEISVLIKRTANIINFNRNLERMIENFTTSELLLLLSLLVLFQVLYQRETSLKYFIPHDSFLEKRLELSLKSVSMYSSKLIFLGTLHYATYLVVVRAKTSV